MPFTPTINMVNTANVAQSQVDLLQGLAVEALNLWGGFLAGSAAITVQIEITTAVPSGRADGTWGNGQTLGSGGGFTYASGGAAFELQGNTIAADSGPDIVIRFHPDYLLNELFLDPTPATRGDNPIDRTDGLSVMLHEMGHALGFTGYYNEAQNNFFANYQTPYDSRLVLINGEVYFDGPNVRAVMGGPIPLTDDNYTHYGNSNEYPGFTNDPLVGLMNGVVFYRGWNYQISDLDLAIMADLGLGTFRWDILDNPFLTAMRGGQGEDRITGGAGNNLLQGDEDNDIVNGGAGDDTIYGGTGDDILNGGDGIDTIYGDNGNDTANGGNGIDFLYGLSGNDVLTGGKDDDVLNGGDGNDRLDGGAGFDYMTGGDGDDTYYVDSEFDGINEDLYTGIDEVRSSANFTLFDNIEILRLVGTATIGTGNALANSIFAGGGLTTLRGMDGNDTIYGGGNIDTMFGGFGNDTLFGKNGNDVLNGDDGDDTIRGEIGSDTINGGAGNDTTYGGDGQDVIHGDDGNDFLRGEAQIDTLYGDAGSDTLQGGDGNDVLYGGSGRDIFQGGAGNDSFWFLEGDFAGLTNGTADRIQDFVQGADRIRLNLIDANTLVAGDQAFAFIGTTAFSNVAGQLRYVQSGGVTLIEGDTNGDGVADFAIALTGNINLLGSDFTL